MNPGPQHGSQNAGTLAPKPARFIRVSSAPELYTQNKTRAIAYSSDYAGPILDALTRLLADRNGHRAGSTFSGI